MSASEKLKALDAGLPDDWKRLSPGEPLIEGPFASVQLICDLRNALPQIVAVVEAAERMTNPDGVVRQGDMSFKRLTPAEVLGPHLAALDEALT
jgi:hypothetical protein